MTLSVCDRVRETAFGTQPAAESRSGASLRVKIDAHLPAIDAHLPAIDAPAARIDARVATIAPEAVTIDAR